MKSGGGLSTKVRVERFDTAGPDLYVRQGSNFGNAPLLSQSDDSIWGGVQILSF